MNELVTHTLFREYRHARAHIYEYEHELQEVTTKAQSISEYLQREQELARELVDHAAANGIDLAQMLEERSQ